MWQLLESRLITGDIKAFCNAVNVWIERPNVCSKIHSCSVISTADIESSTTELVNKTFPLDIQCQSCLGKVKTLINDISCKTRKLVPKQPDLYHPCHETLVIGELFYMFCPVQKHESNGTKMKPTYLILYHQCDKQQGSYIFMYVLQSKTLDEKNIDSVNCQSHLKDCFVTEDWLRSVLMPTLVKWCNDDQTNNSKLPPSHSLINQERYSILYHELKKKYGLHLAKIWPEVTDPQKFVYEDVAIATYLIVVWETERQQLGTSHKLQSFIDLGCGNGLLVHILSSEGYPGKGVDIKRRKIWDIYGGATCLEETTVTPNDQELVAGYDWILGNHSDELTPWIPIMAARSSYHTRYWVLPCCFFDLYSKFERRQSTQGQYHDYLGYVEQVARICGFNVEVDVMRIPSTKRVCHLGMRRLYQESNQQKTLKNISNFVQSSETQSFNHEFAARPKDQKVRNCTKMDRNVQNEIVNKLTKHLLETVNLRKKRSGGNWNCGGSMPLNKAIELLDFSLTDMMKNECGGLQTLLRNHHQVFKVSKGCFSIRDWSDVDQSKHRKKGKPSGQICVKTKLCWFHMNHPDGCPRSANKCSFAHGKEDQFISK